MKLNLQKVCSRIQQIDTANNEQANNEQANNEQANNDLDNFLNGHGPSINNDLLQDIINLTQS